MPAVAATCARFTQADLSVPTTTAPRRRCNEGQDCERRRRTWHRAATRWCRP